MRQRFALRSLSQNSGYARVTSFRPWSMIAIPWHGRSGEATRSANGEWPITLPFAT